MLKEIKQYKTRWLQVQPQKNANKNVTFKNFAPFNNCISEINNTPADDAHDIDTVLPMYNLIEYSDIYSRTSGSLWQYY